ncbi:MAG: PGPGW domain-containing protein [Ignavibacteriales bacterium]|nr:PGPGW domain-containing protein [Ignavibacteriales bacterium]
MISERLKSIKRIIIAIVGTTVLLIGIALIVLPGPAFILIPAGIAILATEFQWAKKLIQKFRQKVKSKRSVE